MNPLGPQRSALTRIANNRSAEFQDEALKRYLPLVAHARALQPQTAVIRGGAGAGKTALFQALAHTSDAQRFFATQIPNFLWVEGFANNGDHPSVAELDAFAKGASPAQLQLFWMLHLGRRLAKLLGLESAFVEEGLPEHFLAAPLAELGPFHADTNLSYVLARFLGVVDNHLKQQRRYAFVGYDALDLLGQWSRDTNTRFAATLLSLWASFGARYTAICPKIFLREDLLDRAARLSVDASKMRARSVGLEWSVDDLYRVVVRHMAAEPELRIWLDTTLPGLVQDEDVRGAMPSGMPEEIQRKFVAALVGPYMGAGVRKGFTHRWIPNHVQDGRGHKLPRSMLVLLGTAAEFAQDMPATQETLLRPAHLVRALADTSKARVAELSTEFPIVRRLERLRDKVVVLREEEVVAVLGSPIDSTDLDTTDGSIVLDRLVELGVLVRRTTSDGLPGVDVPDLFREGYGIKRKGGAAR
jgi:hypothetical protein